MALSLYIFQSLCYIFIFYSFGFGLYGYLNRLELFLIGGLMVVIQLLLATLLLRRFKQGPLEYLLRRLSYKKIKSSQQPVLKAEVGGVTPS